MTDESGEEYVQIPADDFFAPVIATLPTLGVDELVALYRKTRDELAEARKAYKQKEANHKDLMARISMSIKEIADKIGVDSFQTKDGTAYRNVKTKYRVANWDAIVQYIKDTGNFQILEKRVAKLATQEIHNETGEVPPGIDYTVEIEFAVRKPTIRNSAPQGAR